MQGEQDNNDNTPFGNHFTNTLVDSPEHIAHFAPAAHAMNAHAVNAHAMNAHALEIANEPEHNNPAVADVAPVAQIPYVASTAYNQRIADRAAVSSNEQIDAVMALPSGTAKEDALFALLNVKPASRSSRSIETAKQVRGFFLHLFCICI